MPDGGPGTHGETHYDGLLGPGDARHFSILPPCSETPAHCHAVCRPGKRRSSCETFPSGSASSICLPPCTRRRRAHREDLCKEDCDCTLQHHLIDEKISAAIVTVLFQITSVVGRLQPWRSVLFQITSVVLKTSAMVVCTLPDHLSDRKTSAMVVCTPLHHLSGIEDFSHGGLYSSRSP